MSSLYFFGLPLFAVFLQFYFAYLQSVKIRNAVATMPHFYIKKLKLRVEGKSKFSYSIRWLSADLLILDKTLVLIMYDTIFGFRTNYQPCYQYFFDENIGQKIEGVSQVFNDAYIQYYGEKLILKGNVQTLLLNGTIECCLTIDAKNMDILSILKKHKITVYP
jgi:hypothetical protein